MPSRIGSATGVRNPAGPAFVVGISGRTGHLVLDRVPGPGRLRPLGISCRVVSDNLRSLRIAVSCGKSNRRCSIRCSREVSVAVVSVPSAAWAPSLEAAARGDARTTSAASLSLTQEGAGAERGVLRP
jgi:hypothetical protein